MIQLSLLQLLSLSRTRRYLCQIVMAYSLPLSGRSASFSSPQRPDLPTHHAAAPNRRVYRCGRCGQPGHRRTNSRCPLRHADMGASSAGAPTAAPGQSRRAGGKKPTKRAARNDKEASKLHYEEITPKLFTFRDIDDVVTHLLSGEAYSIAERVLWKLQPYFSGLPSLDMRSTRAHPSGTERSAYDFVRVFLPDGCICIETLFRCTKAQLAIKKKPPLVPGEMRQYLGTFYAMSNYTCSLSFIINDVRPGGFAGAACFPHITRLDVAVEVLGPGSRGWNRRSSDERAAIL